VQDSFVVRQTFARLPILLACDRYATQGDSGGGGRVLNAGTVRLHACWGCIDDEEGRGVMNARALDTDRTCVDVERFMA
jgi:hypothetical protein